MKNVNVNVVGFETKSVASVKGVKTVQAVKAVDQAKQVKAVSAAKTVKAVESAKAVKEVSTKEVKAVATAKQVKSCANGDCQCAKAVTNPCVEAPADRAKKIADALKSAGIGSSIFIIA